jgi:hypothetical protein
MMPERIQLKRTKGWRMPPNSVKVDRSTQWGNPFRVGMLGRVLIHASKGMTRDEYEDGQDPLWARGGPTIELPAIEKLERGGIVGSVEIVDCVADAATVRAYLLGMLVGHDAARSPE